MQSSQAQQADLEAYSDITLEEDEIQEALRKAREEKHFQAKRIAYNQSLIAEMMPKKFSPEEMLAAYAKHYTIDADNENVVKNLCCYFAEDKRFQGKLDRGLLLYGTVGVGKTSIMDFFTSNQKASYIMTSCRQVETAYATEGNEGLQKYFSHYQANTLNSFGQRERGFCFDDLGTEPPVTKYYGTDKAAMTEVILNRYDFGLPFTATHITTNLKAGELESRYGTRAVDRMREMFNFIEFTGEKSRRAK